jgi:hypothetical protein
MAFLTKAANRGSIATGYDIDNSCKFEDDNDEWLYRTNASGTNTRTWTVSWWFKLTELRSVNGAAVEMWHGGAYGEATRAGIFADDRIWIDIGGGDGNTGTLFRSLSTQKIRDTSAWYHIVIACDSTQSTEADRLKVWLNGVEVTAWDQKQYPTLNFGSALAGFAGIQMKWGSYDATYHGHSGYLAECNYVDGVTATQNDFGEFDEDSGIWKPKEYEGSYGTNGCYLDFEISSDLGANAKGDDRNFSLNNITSADQATDTPTNNFATGNPLVNFSNPLMSTFNAITEGATKLTKGANGWETLSSTIAVTSGKWYMEFQNITMPESAMASVFPADIDFIAFGGQIDNYAGKVSGDGGISYYSYNGNIYQNASNASYGSAWANETNTMAIALDMDNGKVYFARANVWQNSGDPTSGATGTGAINLIEPSKPHMMGYAVYANNTSGAVNFGGYTPSSISSAASDANGYGTFEYAPPSGYYALCSKNLAEFG